MYIIGLHITIFNLYKTGMNQNGAASSNGSRVFEKETDL